MSFDLTFSRDNSTLPTEQELTTYFSSIDGFSVTRTDSGAQYWYANDDTGVYCHFDLETNGQLGDPSISFNLNYIRPSFFAYECMPIVVEFCREFDLRVNDPQEGTKRAAVLHELVDSWMDHNANAVNAIYREPGIDFEPRHYPEDRSKKWWLYAFERRKIELKLGDELFVPTVLLLELEEEIQQLIVLASGVAQLLPAQADLVIVEIERGEYGLVSYADLLNALEPLLSEIDTAVGPVRYIPHGAIEEATIRVAQLNATPVSPGDLTRAEADSFHNVLVTLG